MRTDDGTGEAPVGVTAAGAPAMRSTAASPAWIASRLALAAAVAIALAALVGSLLPRVPMPEGPFGDKIVHALGYAALAVAWRLALRVPTAAVAAGVFAFGAGIEVLQGLTPWRSFQWTDMLANGTGALVGLAAWRGVVAIVAAMRRRRQATAAPR